MFHRHKDLILFLASLFFILSLLTPVLNFVQETQTKKNIDQQAAVVQQILDRKLDYLYQTAQEIVDSKTVDQYIKNEDILELSSILDQLKNKYNLKLLLAVNGEGVALSRIGTPAKRGDYILQNTDWGQALMQKQSVKVIDKSPNYPLLLLGAVPILENDNFIGAIVVAENIDDQFALTLKEQSLKSTTQLAFYSDAKGVTGSSFAQYIKEQTAETTFIDSYFNTYSSVIASRPDSQQYDFFNIFNHNFLIKKVAIPGQNLSQGGVLIFGYNNNPLFSLIASLIFTTTIILIIVLYFCLTGKCLITQGRFTRKNGLILGLLGVLIAAGSFLAINAILNKKYTHITKPSYLLYNSILKISPEQGIIDKNFRHRAAIMIEPGGEPINGVTAIINFDPKIIQVDDIITINSFCNPDTFLEKSIDNDIGQINISCITAGSSFLEREGIVAELLINPIKVGDFELTFDKSSRVLAKDGLSTDVLRLTIGGYYQIKDYTALDDDTDKLLVFSTSHPNGARWYNTRNINLSWAGQSNSQYSYLLDQAADSIPDEKYLTAKNNINLIANTDGIWYFHIKQIKNNKAGPTSHLKIKIDTTPPEFTEIFASQTTIKTGDIVRLMFASKDELSPKQSHYIQIDKGIFLPVVSPVYIPFTDSGQHQITVRVYDQANNFSEHKIAITVTGQSFWQDYLHINVK